MTSELLITGARVHSSPERTVFEDVRVTGTRIVGHTTPLHCPRRIAATNATVVPLIENTVFDDAHPPDPRSLDLAPGRPATFVVIRGAISRSRITTSLVVRPRDLLAVVIDGEIVADHGAPTTPAGAGALPRHDWRLGSRTDRRRDMTQILTADGRYTETRNGRRDAYTGRFWLYDRHIIYLDDSGFWAFGQYHREVLHHAGYVLRPDARR